MRDRPHFFVPQRSREGVNCGCGTTTLFTKGGLVPRRTAGALIEMVPRGPARGNRGRLVKRAMANGVKFGRKRKLSDYQRQEAIKRRANGETLASIARSYAVDVRMISRLRESL
jgi:hypothetical protein